MYSKAAVFEYICKSDRSNSIHEARKQSGFREEKQHTAAAQVARLVLLGHEGQNHLHGGALADFAAAVNSAAEFS